MLSPRVPCALCALLLIALVLPAGAHASASQLALFQDDRELLQRGSEVRDARLDELKALGADVVKAQVYWARVAPSGTAQAGRLRRRRPLHLSDRTPSSATTGSSGPRTRAGCGCCLPWPRPRPAGPPAERGDAEGVYRPSAASSGASRARSAALRRHARGLGGTATPPGVALVDLERAQPPGLPSAAELVARHPHRAASLPRAGALRRRRPAPRRPCPLHDPLRRAAADRPQPPRPPPHHQADRLPARVLLPRPPLQRLPPRVRRHGLRLPPLHAPGRAAGARAEQRRRNHPVDRPRDGCARPRGRARPAVAPRPEGVEHRVRLSVRPARPLPDAAVPHPGRSSTRPSGSRTATGGWPAGRSTAWWTTRCSTIARDRYGLFQAALRFDDGSAKQSVYEAYRSPIFVRLSGTRSVELWGAARPAAPGARVEIQQRLRGTSSYRRLRVVTLENARGYFRAAPSHLPSARAALTASSYDDAGTARAPARQPARSSGAPLTSVAWPRRSRRPTRSGAPS